MNKTILIFTNYIGGLYSFRKEVIEAIVNEGFKVVISAPQFSEERESYFLNLGCHIEYASVDRRGTNPIRDAKLIIYYLRLILRYHPATILTYTIKPNIYGGLAASLCRVPQLANITGLGTSIENPGLLQKFTIFLYRLGLRRAHKVFCQNAAILNFCKQHSIGRNLHQLPGSGVNLEWHTFQSYPNEEEPLRFNFIGRMMKDKGIEELLGAAIAIHEKYPSVQFHLLGPCEENYEDVLNACQTQGVLEWHGRVDDVRTWIKDSSCTILPSYHEGMANVLLESSATGRPVITTNVSGCKEIVDNGITGYLCQVKDAEDLTAKIEQFINLPYPEKVAMGEAARRKVVREFDRNIVVRIYLEEIKTITESGNSDSDKFRSSITDL